jgi:MFS family permease
LRLNAGPLRGPAGVVATAVLLLGTVAFLRVALLPQIGHDLVLRPGLLSLVTVVFGVGRLLTDLPAGHAADRIGPLQAFALSAAGLAAASVLFAVAHSLAALLVAAAVLGVASATTNTTGMAYFSHAPRAVRGKSLATFSAALLGGQSLGPAVAGVVAGAAGWRAAEGVGAAVAAVVGVACVLGARVIRRPAAVPQDAGDLRDGGRIDARQLGLLYFVSFAVFFALGAMPQTLLPVIGSSDYGLSVGIIGLALGVGGICRFVGAAVGGVLADRVSRKAALVPALLAMGAGSALLELPGGVVVWLAAVVLLSLGSFGGTVAATILADLGGGRRVGRRLGAYRFAGDLGLIAGPLVAGWLYDGIGTGAAVIAVSGLLAGCAVVTAVGLGETRHGDAPAVVEQVA